MIIFPKLKIYGYIKIKWFRFNDYQLDVIFSIDNHIIYFPVS